jgi:tripartite-type tricarboxylate transporter receptor subunit TctC
MMPWLSCAMAATRYPSKPVRFIVGQGPGGPSDIVARLVAREFTERGKEAVVVENHPGATGTIGARMVARSPADGYTLLVASNGPIASAPVEVETAGYDPLRAWAPVARFARGGYVLAVRSGLDVTTVRDFVARARALADSVSVSTVGVGSNSSRALALLRQVAGARILEVPYNGGALALQAVIAGHVDATFCEFALAAPLADSGALRILAAASSQRLALAPDLPTFADLGFPGVATESWYGIVAPAGTPAGVIAELVASVHSMLAEADMRHRLTALGCEPIVETPEEFAEAIRMEYEQAQMLAQRRGAPR